MTQPILLVTRPEPSASAFAQKVRGDVLDRYEQVISPVLQIESTNAVWTGKPPNGLIFTSVNGVRHAKKMGFTDLAAWCVGDRTAQAARDVGFDAKSARGNADDLVELITAARPAGPLMHIRGEHSRGEVLTRLCETGVEVVETIAYRQVEQTLNAQARNALEGERPVVLPLFSPRSARILAEQTDFGAPVIIVAISDVVAKQAEAIPHDEVVIARQPHENAMIDLVRGQIGRFVLGDLWVRPHMSDSDGGIVNAVQNKEGGGVTDSTDKNDEAKKVDDPETESSIDVDAVDQDLDTSDTLEADAPSDEDEVTQDADPDLTDDATDALAEADADIEEMIADEIEEEAPEAEPEHVEAIQAPEPPVPPVTETTIIRQGGFVPMLLGGLVAGGIGYSVAYYQGMQGSNDGLTATISAQADQIAELEATLAALPDVPDVAPLEAANLELSDRVNSQIADATQGLAAMDQRLSDLEKQPQSDGTLGEAAIAAYERELAELREEVAQSIALSQEARNGQVQSDELAMQAAQIATARAALGRIQAAIDTGSPFDGALGDLTASSDVAVPDVLNMAAAEGVPSVSALRASFPEAARAALGAARDEGVDQSAGGLTGFLQNQFQVRSVEPRDGTDPDAILSRAEHAMSQGRLSDALAEIDVLPEVVRGQLSDWLAMAQLRSDALAAAENLSQSLNEN